MMTKVRDIMTPAPTGVTHVESVAAATRVMRENGVRRVPVVDNGTPVGVVSIGDLALWLDEGSALADVAAAPPNT